MTREFSFRGVSNKVNIEILLESKDSITNVTGEYRLRKLRVLKSTVSPQLNELTTLVSTLAALVDGVSAEVRSA